MKGVEKGWEEKDGRQGKDRKGMGIGREWKK